MVLKRFWPATKEYLQIYDYLVTRSVNTNDAELSPQEERTINSIVNASLYPLSIVLIGVGDGPWEDMKKFDDKIPAREFDNFQFVNFTAIMSKNTSYSEKETAFALAALMEIPIQYKATKEYGILGRVTGKAKKIVPRPPPVPYTRQGGFPERGPSNVSAAMQDDQNQVCPVCLTNGKDMAFGCGHMRLQPKIVGVSHLSATYHESTQAIHLMIASKACRLNLRSTGRQNYIKGLWKLNLHILIVSCNDVATKAT
ncbi:E3 ubiquitin-protein ligase rglg2 [Phtheirospermum japonicum]|uniref:E3 ubiquitin-protein ligase rglg2 n=1 Tax=Phtheirospermum japonicum TaxID=374723 RepID=A0A830B477_9LAMI|nr:E3 ubiquitin-protein ligase rglg2 [Phtheirospermum japonicum]